MTLAELRSDVFEDCNHGATPPQEIVSRVTKNINKAHRAVLREPGMHRLAQTFLPRTFASVASVDVYGLPHYLTQITAITERDNDRSLVPMTIDEIRVTDPGFTQSSSVPWGYVALGYGAVQRHPAGTGLWVASSSASDTTQTAEITGLRTSLAATGQTAALNGTTRVAVGSFTDYQQVQSFTLNGTCVGTVSLFDASSSGNTLAVIPIGATSVQYQQVQLYPTPSTAITYYVDGDVAFPDLATTNDVPLLPDLFHDILSDYAKMCEYQIMEDARWQAASDRYAVGLGRLKHYISGQRGDSVTFGRPLRRRFSRLGPWTPAEW